MAYIEDATKPNKLKPSSSAVQKPEVPKYEAPKYETPKYETPVSPQAAPQVDYAGMIADALREQQEAAARKLQAQIKQGVNTLESQRPELQQQYDQAAQSAYVQNMLSKRDLPQAMAASGYTGGLHESSLVDLDNTYGNNLNALKTGYNSSVNALDRDIANLKATGNISLAENSNNYAQLIAEAAREAQAAQLEAQTKYAGASTMSAKDALDAYNSGIRTQKVVDILNNYYGGNHFKSDEATTSSISQSVLQGSQYQSAYTSAEKENAIRAALSNSANEADAIAQLTKAGITQADILAYQNKYGYNIYQGPR